jgi:hypothetical protein
LFFKIYSHAQFCIFLFSSAVSTDLLPPLVGGGRSVLEAVLPTRSLYPKWACDFYYLEIYQTDVFQQSLCPPAGHLMFEAFASKHP